ncbi:MAG: amino acid decarboxylase [Oscillibacter sp.]|nr:amino acid decarboxylase [Oscillibacter sp.]
METPIYDFVTRYAESGCVRAHMPGHKGRPVLGCEGRDITEIAGADSLYEAGGIIAQSEASAAALFGAGATLYSTEGSSQCIRAMLYLALLRDSGKSGRRTVAAARNVHKSFLTACALLDLDVVWLWPEDERYSLCRCTVSPEQLRRTLEGLPKMPAAVYVTSLDYLGGTADLAALAKTAHSFGVPLLADNAHGAYLHFLTPPRHPLDLGADLCCDSAHKTLPVLTGGAYLHIAPSAPAEFFQNARTAMALFGSTSPSYLTLQSLDLANRALAGDFPERLAQCAERVEALKAEAGRAGWQIAQSDPLRLTLSCAKSGWEGPELSAVLRREGVECEYADPDFLVAMLTPENTGEDFRRIGQALRAADVRPPLCRPSLGLVPPEVRCSIRQAVFAPQETVPAREAEGRVLASATVGCPPAVPAAVCGEVLSPEILEILRYYHLDRVNVIREPAAPGRGFGNGG